MNIVFLPIQYLAVMHQKSDNEERPTERWKALRVIQGYKHRYLCIRYKYQKKVEQVILIRSVFMYLNAVQHPSFVEPILAQCSVSIPVSTHFCFISISVPALNPFQSNITFLHLKTSENLGFLTFSGGMEMWHWTKMG